ncbi:MAG TPA: Dabb family protein [Segetibacter sp.]
MKKENRRKFLTTSAALGAGIAASAMPFQDKKIKNQVIHHVFFWLKNPSSKEDLAKLIAGLKTLEGIETVRKIHIGVPASTEIRPVVDNSYSASELLFFDDLAGQKTYQDHPIHLKFIENCSALWEKVIVYDVIDA